MIRQVVYRYVSLTHDWRDDSHKELAELYASVSLRSLSLSMISIFLPIYLYNLGFSLQQIMVYYLLFSVFRIPLNFLAAWAVGRIGPKHTIALAGLMSVFYMLILHSLESFGWPIWLLALSSTISAAFFFTAYHVDFSKIKQTEDAGKELAHMVQLQKIFSMLGPLIGGYLSTKYSIQLAIVVSTVVMVVSLIPLFFSKEPVKRHQHVIYEGITKKLLKRWRSVVALIGINSSSIIINTIWVLFLGVAVFVRDTYLIIGMLATATTVLSIFSARLAGRLSDSGKAAWILSKASWLAFITAAVKPLINSPLSAAGHGLIENQAYTAKIIPVAKGYYAEADEFVGQRIAYIAVTECLIQLARVPFYIGVLIALNLAAPESGFEVLRYASMMAGLLGLLALFQKFPVLAANKKIK